jgi:succinate dehydrogenase / fumarate reductase cytochrome b subunit
VNSQEKIMPARTRPLSPHLLIYRWQMGNSLSILHRMTGIALAFGLAALCFWLVSLAGGSQSYRGAAQLFASPLGLMLLAGWSFAFLYHLMNGVRHLFWDMGVGFERGQRRASGWFAVLGAFGATLALWLALWHFGRL